MVRDFACVLAIVLCFLPATEAASRDVSDTDAWNLLSPFASFIASGTATRLHIDHLPYSIHTVTRVLPWTIARSAGMKCDVAIGAPLRSELNAIFAKVRSSTSDHESDIRWGVTTYDSYGDAINTLYLGRTFPGYETVEAWVDGHWLTVNRELVDWLEAHFGEQRAEAVGWPIYCWIRGDVVRLLIE
jgi:hypothetical protein